MDKIFLDKKDVEAIARQRPFDVPKVKWWEYIMSIVVGLIAVISIANALIIHEAPVEMNLISGFPAWKLAAGIAVFFLAILMYFIHKHNKPYRAAYKAFVEQWEKTGEIKPRWPGLLGGNEGG